MIITGAQVARFCLTLSIVFGCGYMLLGVIGILQDVDYLMANLFVVPQLLIVLSMEKKDTPQN